MILDMMDLANNFASMFEDADSKAQALEGVRVGLVEKFSDYGYSPEFSNKVTNFIIESVLSKKLINTENIDINLFMDQLRKAEVPLLDADNEILEVDLRSGSEVEPAMKPSADNGLGAIVEVDEDNFSYATVEQRTPWGGLQTIFEVPEEY